MKATMFHTSKKSQKKLLQYLRIEVWITNGIVRVALPLLWMGFIFYLSSFPDLSLKGEFAPYDFILRKIAHVTEYAVLSFLLKRNFHGYVLTGLLSFAYAITDEIHQYFVPGRSGNFADLGIDAVGVLIGLIVYYWITKKGFLQKMRDFIDVIRRSRNAT